MSNWHIIFPRIKEDILTKKRTVLHLPLFCDMLVGDYILIHSDNPTDNIYADTRIRSIKLIYLKDISKESILKMNIESHQEYFDRLYEAYPDCNLTPETELFEIEFEYGPDLSKEDNEYFMGIYKNILTDRANLLQYTQQTEDNNLTNNLTDTKY